MNKMKRANEGKIKELQSHMYFPQEIAHEQHRQRKNKALKMDEVHFERTVLIRKTTCLYARNIMNVFCQH